MFASMAMCWVPMGLAQFDPWGSAQPGNESAAVEDTPNLSEMIIKVVMEAPSIRLPPCLLAQGD